MKSLHSWLFSILLLTALTACQPKKVDPPTVFEEIFCHEIFSNNACPVEIAIQATKGPIKHESANFGWLNTAYGPIDLKFVNVSHGVYTDQELFAEDSNLAGLNIGQSASLTRCKVEGENHIGTKTFGCLRVDKTTFDGPVTINGNVMAENSCFGGPLDACSSIISLSFVQTKSIDVHSPKNCTKPIVKLCSNTLVDGDIWFESENGVVIVDDNSYVNGSVIGGTVVTE